MDLDILKIDEVVIHRLPKRLLRSADTNENPLFTDTPIRLTEELADFFRDRIRKSVKGGFLAEWAPPADHDNPEAEVISSAHGPSDVPQAVVDYFRSNMTTLVETSRCLAEELYRRQTGSVSAGLLVVIAATAGPSSKNMGAMLGVLKLEDDQALLVEELSLDGGGITFHAEVRDVTLPESAKVFKAALFGRAEELDGLEAIVSDQQRDANAHGSEVANFFLRFLGCKLKVTPARATKAFLESAQRFINGLDDDAARFRYQQALAAELASNTTVIDPTEFARKHLEAEHRDGFLREVSSESGRLGEIEKDLELLGERFRRITYEFEGGLRVSGPATSIDELLKRKDGHWVITAEMARTRLGGPR